MANEILLMADVLSSEKGVEKQVIFEAIEAALATATRKRHREDIEARVHIFQDTGDYESFRRWEVIAEEEEIEFPTKQITFGAAQIMEPEIQVGEYIEEELEPIEFGRIAAQAAKQVILQKVREAERNRIAAEFEPKLNDLVSGVVKRVERGDIIIDVGGVEALLPRTKMIPREGLRPGDRIRAILIDVRVANRGPQLVLDRVTSDLVLKLFRLEVPEAGEGIIEILSAARDPGLRAKIAVKSHDGKIDPVGACVGIRGSRVQSVSNEIGGERVDIIKWADDPAQFVINALAPAEVESIMLDEDKGTMDVVVDEENLSQAIGRGGQNVRLASELTGWDINIMSHEQANEKIEEESVEVRKEFIEKLDIGDDVASILVQEGFTQLEEVAYVPREELLAVEEFDETLVDELRSRAEDALVTLAILREEQLKDAQPAQDLLDMEGMDETTAKFLALNDIKTMEDLAECAVDEIIDIDGIDAERAESLIMTARKPWFEAAES
ncbi:MAG: transcription termination factor NusA [Arenicella sp.]